jgi:hypothetical protein
MPTERKLVYRLDERMAASGVPKELHIILGDGMSGSALGTEDLLLVGRSQGIPFVEFLSYWADRV